MPSVKLERGLSRIWNLEKTIEIREKLGKETGRIESQVGPKVLALPYLPTVCALTNGSSRMRPAGFLWRSALPEVRWGRSRLAGGQGAPAVWCATALGASLSAPAKEHFPKPTLMPLVLSHSVPT